MKPIIELHLCGQVHGGKNNINITKTGHRYPNPKFVMWRNDAINQILAQIPPQFKTIDTIDLVWNIKYTPEDHRRRDLPAILDALFHCFEKADIVKDDYLIKNVIFTSLKPDKNASVVIQVFEPGILRE